MKKIMSLLLLALLNGSLGLSATAGLVGIVNNSNNAQIIIQGKGPGGQDVTLNPTFKDWYEPVKIPNNSSKAEGNKFDDALNVQVKYHLPSGDTEDFFIKIAQVNTFANFLGVKARVEHSGHVVTSTAGTAQGGTPSPIMASSGVSSAINSAWIAGFTPDPWGGVILVIKDKAVGTKTEIPFDFAISAWATNRVEWRTQSKTNFLQITQTPGGTKFIDPSNGKTVKKLNVIQGQQGFGGGPIPLPKRAHIAHIYNNSSFMLELKREAVAAAREDTILIPPFSTIPYLMMWVPIRSEEISKSRSVQGEKPNIKVSIYRPAQGPSVARPDENLIKDRQGKVVEGTLPDELKNIFETMGITTKDDASELMGNPTIESLIVPTDDTKFYASTTIYRIFVPESDNKISIYSQEPEDAEGNEKPIQQILQSKEPAYKDLPRPGYFELLVTEKDQKINFELKFIQKLEKPYENKP